MKFPRRCLTRRYGPGPTVRHAMSRACAPWNRSVRKVDHGVTLRKAMIAAAMWLRAMELRWSFSYRTSSLRAVGPTVANLHHPAASPLHWAAPLGIRFFATTDNMRDVVVRLYDFRCAPASITSVGAQVLATPHPWRLALNHDSLQYRVELCDVTLIRSDHDERQTGRHGNPPADATCSPFFPDPRGWDRRTLAQAGR